ncbi:MAG: hypothetical protein QNJ89_10060 [Acidimicrobiia bacterium]|nr:hypothetical protein [Acidimicrobiia bacterium]
MSRRSLGFALLAVGLVFAAISSLADQIGIGDEEAFGWQQIGGLVVGLLVAAAGFVIASLESKSNKAEES